MAVADSTLLRFATVGVVNSAGGYLAIVLLLAAGLGNILSNLLGYLIGLCSSFLLNRHWTFSSTGDTASLVIRFVLVIVVAYLCNLAVVVWLLDSIGASSFLAQAAGLPVYALVSYLGMKTAVFCKRRTEA